MNLIVILFFNYFLLTKNFSQNIIQIIYSCLVLNGALILSLTVSIASLALDHLLGPEIPIK